MQCNNHIGIYQISEKICDDFINFYEQNTHLTHPGAIHFSENGESYDFLDDSFKKSTDLRLSIDFPFYPSNLYFSELQQCISQYISDYPDADKLEPFAILEPYVVQKYKKNEGFFARHYENNGCIQEYHRVLVYMTYLNDVPNGGTHFPMQNFTSEAKKGLTLIWPAYFTHPHHGVISSTHEKYIITGWLNNIDLYNRNT